MTKIQSWLRKHWFWLVVNVAAAIPLLQLAYDAWQGNLGVNPITTITNRTGTTALVLLILSLACTPANIILGWRQPLAVRKALGLWAFVYASFHLLNFVGLDYGFNVRLILADGLPTKPYILVGLLAFLILVPLAVTSTKGWKKRLGPRWKSLHSWVYLAGIAAVVHFFWKAKAAERLEPVLYGLALALLLIVRLPPVRKRIVNLRRSLGGGKAPVAMAKHAPAKAERSADAVGR